MLKSVVLNSCLIMFMWSTSYIPTDTGSTVKFRIKNTGIGVTGAFKGLQGKIHFDPVQNSRSSFEVFIDAATINTGIDLRDDHLRAVSYLDVKKYPKISFVSTMVSPAKTGEFILTGKLTIKNITKEISFPFKANPHNGGFLFTGEFRINRRDFNVGGSSITLSDNLTVSLSVFAARG